MSSTRTDIRPSSRPPPPGLAPREIARLRASEVPEGTMVSIPHPPFDVVVANVRGKFYAVEDACPHGGFPLSQGELDGPWITCPGHGWVLSVRHGGFETGDLTQGSARTYSVLRVGDDIVVVEPPRPYADRRHLPQAR